MAHHHTYSLSLAALLSVACAHTVSPSQATPRRLIYPASTKEYAVYSEVLRYLATRGGVDALFLRDSAQDYTSTSLGQIALARDSLTSSIQIVLLGHKIEQLRDWRPIFKGQPNHSPILRLFRTLFAPDSLSSTAWVQERCGPVVCGGIEEIRLKLGDGVGWKVVSSQYVLDY